MSEYESIPNMAALFQQAREKGFWLHCNYQDLWFSPDELEKAQSEGRFRWGAVNWKVEDPRQELEYLNRQIDSKIAERDAFKKRAGL